MMRVVFFDKKAETYEAIENVAHMHVDLSLRPQAYALYTDDGIKLLPLSKYRLHKVDC